MGTTDCSRCVGLCCVALAFDRSAMFAFDKAAGDPCRHLTSSDCCGVHDDLVARGMGGCARYDCGGAGPAALITIRRSWREGPAAAAALFDAFSIAREVREARDLVDAARALPLSEREEAQRRELTHALDVAPSLEAAAAARAFLRALRDSPAIASPCTFLGRSLR